MIRKHTQPDNGTIITVAKIPLRSNKPILGHHQRLEGQRLDLTAVTRLITWLN